MAADELATQEARVIQWMDFNRSLNITFASEIIDNYAVCSTANVKWNVKIPH